MEIRQITFVANDLSNEAKQIERLCLDITYSSNSWPDQEDLHISCMRDELNVKLAKLAETYKTLKELI